MEGAYCEWNFQVLSCFGFVMATLQLFQHPENVKISILPFRLSHQKSYIFTSIWRIFKNFLFAARHGTWLSVVENCKGSGILVLQWQRYNFSNIQKMYKFQFFPLDSSTRNAISSTSIWRIFKNTFFGMKDDGTWLLSVKSSSALTYFSFAIATLQIFQHPENVKISLLPFTLSRQKCYIFETYLTNSQKTFFWLKDDERWLSVRWKFQGLRYFNFPMATLQIFQHPENVKISILPFTLSRQKCYIFESI